MTKPRYFNAALLLSIVFLLSRILIPFFGVRMDFGALFRYWQYLDVTTLRTDLLRGVWFDHTQPPVFNLFLGLVLKLSGSYAPFIFSLLFEVITLLNTFLLLATAMRVLPGSRIPFWIALFYLLSPATILFENELFYTSFITFFLLTACYFLSRFPEGIKWQDAAGFFLSLAIICLTRSMYHLLWLVGLSLLVLWYYRGRSGFRHLLYASGFAVLLTGSWYIKNYFIFKSFTASTWMGMNVARNIFHDADTAGSNNITGIEPFSRISAYRSFLPPAGGDFLTPQQLATYRGLNDRDLLQEWKNDSFINEKHLAYISVAKQYMTAGKQQIKAHPSAFLKNVLQSAIIFFAPATRYPSTEYLAARIKWYDVLYSFNLSHFAHGKQQRRIALTLSALPKILLYLLVFSWLFRSMLRRKTLSCLNLVILFIFSYLFVVSSLFEHYENMRFRYEAEPLFLLLAAQALSALIRRRKDASAAGK